MRSPFDAFTERMLVKAGVRPGMRVLDLGCGRGEVSLMLARLVGPDGAVVGLDRDGEALQAARDREETQNLKNLRFIQTDLAEAPLELDGFDVVAARRVMMYVQNRAQALGRILTTLRPGGAIAFQEHESPSRSMTQRSGRIFTRPRPSTKPHINGLGAQWSVKAATFRWGASFKGSSSLPG